MTGNGFTGICQMDGYTEDEHGNEHYWSCWEPAITTATDYSNGQPPYIIRVCAKHAEDFEETGP